MLVGVHPLLTGQLLCALDAMGHGDTVCIADANFPANRLARTLIELPGCTTTDAVVAVLTVFALDEQPGSLMGDDSGRTHDVQRELQFAIDGVSPTARLDALDRRAFYRAAADASVIVRTGEHRAYGNVILRRGVIDAKVEPARRHERAGLPSVRVGRRVPWIH